MELYEVMRSAFSAREFTPEAVDDAVIARVLEHARFAPSGGNRQGWHVIIVREQATKDAIAELAKVPAKRYGAQVAAGEFPWNTIVPTKLTPEQIAATEPPRGLSEPYRRAPVVIVVCVDLRVVASVDSELARVGVISVIRHGYCRADGSCSHHARFSFWSHRHIDCSIGMISASAVAERASDYVPSCQLSE